MPARHPTEFSSKDVKLAEMAKAMAHPARVAILRELARRGTCICGEIVKVLPLAQSTVSQHLKELKNAGLIRGEVEGTASCYCIDWTALNTVRDAFQDVFTDFEKDHVRSCC